VHGPARRQREREARQDENELRDAHHVISPSIPRTVIVASGAAT
jgi:hypothetical protein